jgi:hypothetical protein
MRLRRHAHTPRYGVAVALGDATGVGVTWGVAETTGVADTSGVAELCADADASGVTLAPGVLEEFTVGLGKAVAGLGTALVLGATVEVGAGFALFSSFSRRPTRLSELCLATKIVIRRVTPNNVPPR